MVMRKSKVVFILGLLAAAAVFTLLAFNPFGVGSSSSSLPLAKAFESYSLSKGSSFQLNAGLVQKEVNGVKLELMAYNGQIPGPLLKVKQGDAITLDFTNSLPQETTIHWHGLRVDNAFDGVPTLLQDPVQPGGSFSYEVKFPDPGLYWYHPHLREVEQQERGLYGLILVEPAQANYFPPASREQVLALDDLLLYDGGLPFVEGVTNFALMGRFGNVMLVNGETGFEMNAKTGEVVRFYLVNTANTRVFNFKVPGVKLKVLGGDNGGFENEYFADSVVLGPSERYVVDAFFERPGTFELRHEGPQKSYTLGKVAVEGALEGADLSQEFNDLHENASVKAELASLDLALHQSREPDVEWLLSLDLGGHMNHSMSAGLGSDGIEWEEDAMMARMNANLTTDSLKWDIKDVKTGKTGEELHYSFKQGSLVKVRIVNPLSGMHPMQHPIHFHGQRFLVLERDGVKNDNLAWKDTVLVPAGSVVDVLLEASNAGKWMAHCHISEHLEAGMMAMFDVE